jgi:hypothetical protein
MTGLDDRAKAFEDKFAHDRELQFKATARRNKLLGIWVAKLLGKNDDELDAYVKSVIISDFAEPGDDDVLRKVLADLEEGGAAMSREELRVQMDSLMGDAMKQLMDEE